MEELKRIRVEVGALQHAVNMKAAAISTKKALPPADLSLSATNSEEERGSERLDAVSIKKKASSSERDKLLAKVSQLLMDEMAREGQLREALKGYKS